MWLAGQLDRLLEQSLVEVSPEEEVAGGEAVRQEETGIRLLASSLRPVHLLSEVTTAKRRKPDLLAHRDGGPLTSGRLLSGGI